MAAISSSHLPAASDEHPSNSPLVEFARLALWRFREYGSEKQVSALSGVPYRYAAKQMKGGAPLYLQTSLAWLAEVQPRNPQVVIETLNDLIQPLGLAVVPRASGCSIQGLMRGNAAIAETFGHFETEVADALADGRVSPEEATSLRTALRCLIDRGEALEAELGGAR